MSELLLRGGRPWRFAGPADVLVRDGVIARIEPDIDAPGAEVFDVSGRLVLPGLVEAHCHLDKTLYGRAWEPHTAGDTLADRIGNERRRRGELGLPDADCAVALLERMVTAGTSYVRTHTDVYPGAGLGGIEAVRDAVRRLGGRVTVEQVAFPQHGILSTPGTAELLDEALKLGVETIGGIDPAGMDRDPVRHLDVVLGLAERHGAGIDIHLHDGGMLGAFELELITERTRASGLVGKVTVSHAYAFGQIDAAYQDRLAAGLAAAGIYGARTVPATCWTGQCTSPTAAHSGGTTTLRSPWKRRPTAGPALSAWSRTGWR